MLIFKSKNNGDNVYKWTHNISSALYCSYLLLYTLRLYLWLIKIGQLFQNNVFRGAEINKHKVWHLYIVSVLMKSEQQCRGIQFHFDLMQIYNANRPTKPQNYFIYTHQTTKEFYVHIHVS